MVRKYTLLIGLALALLWSNGDADVDRRLS